MPSFTISRVHLILPMLCLLSFNTRVSSKPLYDCPNTTFYTPDSSYHANLNLLFSALSSNTTRENGFYNYTAGSDPPDIAYGLFLCRGDVTTEDCQDCVNTAIKEVVKEYCPRGKMARIWYENCFLRYSNQTIFSIRDQSFCVALPNNRQKITGPIRFRKFLEEMMNELATQAANGNDQLDKKFATKESNFTTLQKVYGLVQCTPDLSIADCKMCLVDAIATLLNCYNGTSGGRVVYPSCNIRYELYLFYRILSPAPAPATMLVLPPPIYTSKGKRGISSSTIVVIVSSVAVAMVLLSIGFCFITKKSRKKYEAVGNDNTAVQSLQYDMVTIESATASFSGDNKIGEGGFGVVYKGTLPNGQEIAVKRLSRNSGQGGEEFKNEALLLAKLQHRNLVRLLGFCLEVEEKLLIYELVPNKSLDYFLFGLAHLNTHNLVVEFNDPEKQGQLDWSKRYKIIRGIARGILYLHEDSQPRIIHRDLKASNILLDGDMNPKISDFGIAKIFGVDQTQGNTSRVVGTFGYMSPEYVMHGLFSVKSDVFSFGILVLEIISGKKNSSFYQWDHAEDISSYAWKHWRNETLLEMMDPTLKDSYSNNAVIRCILIGLLCVQEDVDARPSMASVILMLNSDSVALPLPQEPLFFFHNRKKADTSKGLESDQSTSKSITWSVTEASTAEE